MSTPCSHLKTSHPVQIFPTMKPHPPSSSSSSSSALSSMKLKSLIHTLIVSHMCRIIRALSSVKAAIVKIIKQNQYSNTHLYPYRTKQKMSKKIIFGSFRLHYNWCSSKSSHVIPVPSRLVEGLSSDHHDNDNHDCHDDSQLAGYLQWLEDKIDYNDNNDNKGNHKNCGNGINEIDMLAEMFIADCHEKFRLEKQESDLRFNEMLARGL
ncbi:hypothetical protein VNO78_21262 [Psophocarpus tetragonolobus]|uniref:Cotton fiber protein n=1 Tax=Psophocarpus tetragonolobus TaxID=3891 RepID=A0AAN9XHY1_PSOTE